MDTNELYQHIVESDHYEERLVLSNPHPELATYLASRMEQKGVSRAQLIRMLNVDRVYGYQLLNGIRRMKRDQLLMTGMYLGLDLAEMDRLLRLGEYGKLYAKDPRDARVIFAVSKKMNFDKALNFIWGIEGTNERESGI